MTPTRILAEIIGPDLLIVLALVALLFGGSQLPKLARSLGSAKSEFGDIRAKRLTGTPSPGRRDLCCCGWRWRVPC